MSVATDILNEQASSVPRHHTWTEPAGFWLFIATLAWAPFPLGSNRPWSWSLLAFLVVACWLLWLASVWNALERPLWLVRRLVVPLVLATLALTWALIQASPWVPQAWVHPVWSLAAEVLSRPVQGAISIDPWRTVTEALKLGMYVAAAWLASMFALRAERARMLLFALILIGAFYGLYALILGLADVRQFQIFYNTTPVGSRVAGPFVLHNSFATYAGLATLCACVRLFSLGARRIVVERGARNFTLSVTQFLLGAGALPALTALFTFSMLVASGSRAGFLATVFGTMVLLALGGATATRRSTMGWASLGVAIAIIGALVLFWISGTTLATRFATLVEAGNADEGRLALWSAASRMIASSPSMGLGLGTFENAYPLYADRVFSFTMDKAHSDYLELAAGWGLPAACAWWASILWLTGLCVRGSFVRRRDRHYSLLAVGATALVAFHSAFDFSLQIPAVALTYATILGLGVAQAFPSRERNTAS